MNKTRLIAPLIIFLLFAIILVVYTNMMLDNLEGQVNAKSASPTPVPELIEESERN
jgi:hypothetical protein